MVGSGEPHLDRTDRDGVPVVDHVPCENGSQSTVPTGATSLTGTGATSLTGTGTDTTDTTHTTDTTGTTGTDTTGTDTTGLTGTDTTGTNTTGLTGTNTTGTGIGTDTGSGTSGATDAGAPTADPSAAAGRLALALALVHHRPQGFAHARSGEHRHGRPVPAPDPPRRGDETG